MTRLTLDTAQFAALLGVDEGELVFAFKSDGVFEGLQLPLCIHNAAWRKRKFCYNEVVKFKEKFDDMHKGIS
ncbi:hypothetical protein IHE77_24830 (plasmid) [Serratia ureilytica]|uniref:hypothetical protein n=1 Tax=Serratia ureilytica TaxID=300181 RepID=UPI00159CC1D3|nr:hypothetical protein [Serratia ureilytica]NVM51930.1 hypothetical protein [Serratia ureilytica]UNE46536.1 hypothetical protein IHE77_24830 [Serratia ureilytica]